MPDRKAGWLGDRKFALEESVGSDATSAKLLLSLAEAKLAKAGGKKKKAGRSQAMELAAEPEWQEPVAEFFAETSGGRREREG